MFQIGTEIVWMCVHSETMGIRIQELTGHVVTCVCASFCFDVINMVDRHLKK